MTRREPSEPAPSLNDFIDALAKTRAPAPEESGLAKYIAAAIGAIAIALCLWVGSTLVSVGQTISTMNANVINIGKAVDDLKTQQSGLGDKVADLQSRLAQHDLRLNAIDQWRQSTNDRLRIVEGQKPLTANQLKSIQ